MIRILKIITVTNISITNFFKKNDPKECLTEVNTLNLMEDVETVSYFGPVGNGFGADKDVFDSLHLPGRDGGSKQVDGAARVLGLAVSQVQSCRGHYRWKRTGTTTTTTTERERERNILKG